MKFNKCQECPEFHHKGAFGSPRYIPVCGNSTLSYKVDCKNHASIDYSKVYCPHLNK